MLIENTLTGERNKVDIAIKRIKAFEPAEGYYLAFSGGKDSCVIKELSEMAGVKFQAYYHITTVDPPEVVQFIRENHKDVIFERPKKTMWELIAGKKMPPTMMARYCCDVLKEGGGKGRVVMTGVRWAESVRRKSQHGVVSGTHSNHSKRFVLNEDNDESRRQVEQCFRTQKVLVNPIIDWLDEDVWEFIKTYRIPYCKLYDEGYKRLGCIACPLAAPEQRERELERWPTYRRAYLRAFGKMLEKADGQFQKAKTPEEVMDWWLYGRSKEGSNESQIEIEELT